HIRASLVGPSLTIPFAEKELLLGEWQQIMYIDFDVRARTRRVIVQIHGEQTPMSRRAFSLIGILPSLPLLVGPLARLSTAARRPETQVRLMGDAWATRGVVLEKLVEEREDRLLPWDVTTYVVRYAYPNDRGQMRTGEQVVTRRFFEQTPEQGEPI